MHVITIDLSNSKLNIGDYLTVDMNYAGNILKGWGDVSSGTYVPELEVDVNDDVVTISLYDIKNNES